MGSIKATPHSMSPLSTCSHLESVKNLGSFIGAYQVLARVIPGCAGIHWTEDLQNPCSGKGSVRAG